MPTIFVVKNFLTQRVAKHAKHSDIWRDTVYRLPNQSGDPQNHWLWISTLNGGTSNLWKKLKMRDLYGFLTIFWIRPFLEFDIN